MKMKLAAFLTAGLLCALSVFPADKLAVAEPVAKGGLDKGQIETFWGILESSIQSDEYKLISRGALKQMMTEIGLTASSDLVNLNSSQKAKLGQLETVKYILISEIGLFGTQLNCTLRILDASTGEIDQIRRANLRVRDLDELADKIEPTLRTLFSDRKQLQRIALLAPVIQVVNPPHFLAGDFNVQLENALLSNGVKLQNLQFVHRILQKNRLDTLGELEPKMYVKVGKLLEVQQLIRAYITRFEIVSIPYYAEETGAQGFRFIGNMEGYVRVVSAQDGALTASIPFEEKINFNYLSRSVTQDWTPEDYMKVLIKTIIPQRIVPALLKVPALKGK